MRAQWQGIFLLGQGRILLPNLLHDAQQARDGQLVKKSRCNTHSLNNNMHSVWKAIEKVSFHSVTVFKARVPEIPRNRNFSNFTGFLRLLKRDFHTLCVEQPTAQETLPTSIVSNWIILPPKKMSPPHSNLNFWVFDNDHFQLIIVHDDKCVRVIFQIKSALLNMRLSEKINNPSNFCYFFSTESSKMRPTHLFFQYCYTSGFLFFAVTCCLFCYFNGE